MSKQLPRVNVVLPPDVHAAVLREAEKRSDDGMMLKVSASAVAREYIVRGLREDGVI